MDNIKQGGEFDFIRYIKTQAPTNADIPLSIGDDTCILPSCEKESLVSTDMLLENIHFRQSHASPELIGHKTATANLSDIAAMGGKAKYFLLSLALPKKLKETWKELFIKGLVNALNEFDVTLVGGDTSASPDKIFINGIILGESVGKPVKRSGAKAGDFIYVSGYPGEAAAAIDVLEKHSSGVMVHQKILKLAQEKHYKRQAELRLGAEISKRTLATSMIDLSDGLVGDISHLTLDFGLGANIWEENIPVSPHFDSFVQVEQKEEMMLNGGEDYQLIFTSRLNIDSREFAEIQKMGVRCIGQVSNTEKIILKKKNGEKVELKNKSFDHFA